MLYRPLASEPLRNPACGYCGGTGYVYLWSVALDGGRVWFCDRSSCTRFWSDSRRDRQ